MAFGRLERARPSQPMSEINMTPLIDVMLVLLVIFMLTAPLMSSSLKLDLPKAAAGATTATAEPHSLMVALSAGGLMFLNEQQVSAAELLERARQSARRQPQTEVQLRADQAVPYGRVAQLIGLLQQAGLSHIAFVTDTPAPALSPAP